MVGCTNELNSILPSTTFSLDSAEAGVAKQEATTVFHLSSPPKIFTHEDGLHLGWLACWLADIVGTPIILMNMIFLFYTNDTNDLKMVLNTYN